MSEVQGLEAYMAARRRLDAAFPGETLRVGNGLLVYAGPDSPLTYGTGIGWIAAPTPAALDRVADFFRERGAVPILEVTSLADPDTFSRLADHGYRVTRVVHVFRRFRDDVPNGSPVPSDAVRVDTVDPARFGDWADVVAGGFAEGAPLTPADRALALGFPHSDGATAFLASVDGIPAGGGILGMLTGDVADLFSASTLPAFRGRGVQAALIRARLERAWEAGTEVARVETDPGSGSQRNVMRQGFRLAYAKLVWRQEQGGH
jgi:GNAT superfamily N-acetyltransferase